MKYLTLIVSLFVAVALSAAPSYTPEQERQVAYCSGLLSGYNSTSSTNMMTYLIKIAKPTDKYHFMLIRDYDRGVGYVNGWHEGCKSQQSCDEKSLAEGAKNAWLYHTCNNYGLDSKFKTPTTPKEVVKKEEKTIPKIGSQPDDEPCTCVFNKNREWNPEKIIWNNRFWKCAHYKVDGTCSEVEMFDIEAE